LFYVGFVRAMSIKVSGEKSIYVSKKIQRLKAKSDVYMEKSIYVTYRFKCIKLIYRLGIFTLILTKFELWTLCT